MNHPDTSKKPDVICKCSGATETRIKELLADGVESFDRISRITGAGSGCGACDSDIMNLLASKAD